MNVLEKYLKPGKVYRRSDFEQWFKAVDRHLKQLVKEGTLEKMSRGLYYCPLRASFGKVPPEDGVLIRAFLKSNDFLMTSPNIYNSLGVGTTQLYNKCVVYNHKRRGQVKLGGKVFDFRLRHNFPKKLSKEFLLVDLLNNLKELAEDREKILGNVKAEILKAHGPRMKHAMREYASVRTKVILNKWLSN